MLRCPHVRETAMSNWEHLHEITCNYPHGPLLGPGCICKVVNKHEYEKLRGELSLAEEGLANYEEEVQAWIGIKAEREAEIGRLRLEVNGLLVENANLRGVRDQLLKDDGETIERLRKAIMDYGFHTSECSAGFPISDHCTCGFSDVMRSALPQT
jgi:hypothetical protein